MRFSLSELMVCAASRIFDDEGEVLVTGIGLLPRLAASLAMGSSNTDILMTDSQSFVLSQPNPVSGLESHAGQANENWMGFARIFDNVWSGRRHALVGPSQIDRFGQSNISALGGTHQPPRCSCWVFEAFPVTRYLMPILFSCLVTAGEFLWRASAMWCVPWDTTTTACLGVTVFPILTSERWSRTYASSILMAQINKCGW